MIGITFPISIANKFHKTKPREIKDLSSGIMWQDAQGQRFFFEVASSDPSDREVLCFLPCGTARFDWINLTVSLF
jgi:hypothetical protein